MQNSDSVADAATYVYAVVGQLVGHSDSATAETTISLFIGMQLSELLKAFSQLIVCCVGPVASDVR